MAEEETTGTVEMEEIQEEQPPAFDPSHFVKMEDFARFEGKVTAMLDNFAASSRQPSAPPTPSGPTMQEQMAKLDSQLEKLDAEFETAINEGKGASAVQRKREAIIQAKADLKYNTRIAELESFGVNAIDQLSSKVVEGSMPHLVQPEVRNAYDKAISSMEPSQRMNPEARMLAYKFAIGENMERILELEKEKILREAEASTTTPGARGKEVPTLTESGYPEGIPAPEEILTQDNLDALNAKGQSADDYYKGMGYGGWVDYWEKVGKAYHYGEEEE